MADDFGEDEFTPPPVVLPDRDQDDEIDLARAVCASLRAALDRKEEEIDALKRVHAAELKAMRDELRMLELANHRLRGAVKGKGP